VRHYVPAFAAPINRSRPTCSSLAHCEWRLTKRAKDSPAAAISSANACQGQTGADVDLLRVLQAKDERQRVRTERSRPLIESLHEWFEVSLPKLSRKSDTTAAIRYALTLWPALTRYCDDGSLEIDNNAAERALRVVALGRKNYLFAGSDLGGERAASIYSLIGSAKLNGLDPEAYLREVLTRIADHPVNRIADLLTWNIVPAEPTHSTAAA
jgi:Transposase IS66 family/IS66 C-terminal element